MALYELLIRGKEDGSISGSHIIDFDANGNPGAARPIKDEDWAGIAPGINEALTSRITELEAELAEIANPTPPPLEPLRPATKLQARVWLIRNGINLDQVPAIIEASYTPGPERLEALERWESAAEIPFDHPLVAIVAAGMTPPVTVADVWPEILAIR